MIGVNKSAARSETRDMANMAAQDARRGMIVIAHSTVARCRSGYERHQATCEVGKSLNRPCGWLRLTRAARIALFVTKVMFAFDHVLRPETPNVIGHFVKLRRGPLSSPIRRLPTSAHFVPSGEEGLPGVAETLGVRGPNLGHACHLIS